MAKYREPAITETGETPEDRGYRLLAQAVIRQAEKDLSPRVSKPNRRAAKDFFAGMNGSTIAIMSALSGHSLERIRKAVKERSGFDVEAYQNGGRAQEVKDERTIVDGRYCDEIEELYSKGMTQAQIGKELGICEATVNRACKDLNLPRRGNQNTRQQTLKNIDSVSRLRLLGKTHAEIMKITGLTKNKIRYAIKRGKLIRHKPYKPTDQTEKMVDFIRGNIDKLSMSEMADALGVKNGRVYELIRVFKLKNKTEV